MREHLFRGIPTQTVLMADYPQEYFKIVNGFVYGNLIADEHSPYIVGGIVDSDDDYCSMEWWCPVQKETVGEWTGTEAINFDTKKKEKVFEGDKLAFTIRDEVNELQYHEGFVYFCDGGFWVDCTADGDDEALFALGTVLLEDTDTQIIGNIHQDAKFVR